MPNMGEHQLHGGPDNFAMPCGMSEVHRQWHPLHLHSPDGDQGFPGALDVSATYALIDNVLSLDFEATTTKPTVINLTNHAYWNLAGKGSGLRPGGGDARRSLPAAAWTQTSHRRNQGCRRARILISASCAKWGRPMTLAGCLNGQRGELRKGLTLRDPDSGRAMEVYTTECAMQFYTADHLGPSMPGNYGPLVQHGSIAIEPQNLSRRAEPREFSVIGPAPRRSLPPPHGMAVLNNSLHLIMPRLTRASSYRRAKKMTGSSPVMMRI